MLEKEMLLESFLEDRGITMDMILNEISILPTSDEYAIIVYCSKIDGLGNKFSDLDLYIVTRGKPNVSTNMTYQDCNGVEVKKVKGVSIDVEYWTFSTLEKIWDTLKNTKKGVEVNEDVLKLFSRMVSGVIVKDTGLAESLCLFIDRDRLEKVIIDKFELESRSSYTDALNLYLVGDFIPSISCARKALDYAVAATNVCHGVLILKQKWFAKIFIDNSGFNNDEHLDTFLKLQFFSQINQDNISDHIEEMLLFIQSMLNNLFIDKGGNYDG